jgi:Spy/CpxP family protein refolding chaperone
MLAATIVAAGLAGWFGVQYGLRQNQASDLDAILHRQLSLTQGQDRQIETLEAKFAVRQNAYEAEMRAANSDLAAAMTRDHVYGPPAQQAIERFHKAMMGLQEETVRHVLAMRAVLTPDQAKTFDAIIAKNLAGPAA